jgi:uncharacterized protein YPO0396
MRKKHIQHTLRLLEQQESAFIERSITRAEQERTEMAKKDTDNPRRKAIEEAHKILQKEIGLLQKGKNISYNIGNTIQRAINKLTNNKHVHFGQNTTIEYDKMQNLFG